VCAIVRGVLRILASGAVVVLAIALLLAVAEGIASFGVGRTTAAEISLAVVVIGSYIVYTLTIRR
jgi:hypothetical protein